MTRWLLAAVAALGVAGHAGGQAGAQAPPRPSVERQWFPFETTPQSGLPIVKVRLNGGEAYRVVLDPSVKEVLLDKTLVVGTGMKVDSRGELVEIDYYGFEEKVPVVYLKQLEVGPVAVEGVRALVIEGDDATGSEGIRSYGRVGIDFLGPFRLTVHYPRKLLLLEPSPPSEEPPGGAPFDSSVRFLTVAARLNQAFDAPFILDPGSSDSMVDRRWARGERLVKSESVLRLSALELGSFRASDVPLAVVDMKELPYSKNPKKGKRARPVGVLGANLLKSLAVTYDFPRGLLWFRAVSGAGGER